MAFNQVLQISEQDLRTVQPQTQPSGASFTPSIKFGQQGATSDGRQYVFGLNNATNAAVAGNIQTSIAVISTEIGRTNAVVQVSGSTQVSVPLGATNAVVANQYAQGYLAVVAGTGIGTMYRIQSNPAASASTTMIVQLVDPLTIALDTTSVLSLYPNPWNLFIISTTTLTTNNIVGVPNVAVPASNYAWLQTNGYCAVVADANAISKGVTILPSVTTAGTVVAYTAAAVSQTLGYAAEAFTASQSQIANLQIA